MVEEEIEPEGEGLERKIIHVDMDCFYAAIEMRDNPELRGKPIAVGGGGRRGVLCTANYEAREFGCRSAMPGFKALELCPELVIVPVRFDVYRAVSYQIKAIFGRFTDCIEPLSLDEAYLDVSHWKTSGRGIAREIRSQIFEETGLTASAGIAPNKMLAKIASDIEKPNGQFEIQTSEVEDFMRDLPVSQLWGVGKKTQERLKAKGFETCGQISSCDRWQMIEKLGNWGAELHEMSQGRDIRRVKPHRIRKSISKETTFSEDVMSTEALRPVLSDLVEGVSEILATKYRQRGVKGVMIKMRFSDFTRTTIERASSTIDLELVKLLLEEGRARGESKAVRLLGFGVRLENENEDEQQQLDMFTDT